MPTFELLDRRILACVVFVDWLGREVRSPIVIARVEGLRSFWKRPGMLIVTNAPGLSAHAEAFLAAPAQPARGSVRLTLAARPLDPGLAPRSFALALPRNRRPDQPDSVFDPLRIVLPPTPVARIDGLAAGLRVSVTRDSDGAAIEGALVRLRPAGGLPQAVALTDAAGEALLIVPAVPLASPGAGAVMQRDVPADLDAIVVADAVRFNAAAEAVQARVAAAAMTSGFRDPDTIAGVATPAREVRIAAGRVMTATIAWSPP